MSYQEYNKSNACNMSKTSDFCDLCQKEEWKTSCDNCDKYVCFKCIKRCICKNELDICDDCEVCKLCNTRTNNIHPFLDKKIFYETKYKTLRIYPTHNDMVQYESESKKRMKSFQDYIDNECNSMRFVMKGMGCDEDKIEQVINSMKTAYESANFLQ